MKSSDVIIVGGGLAGLTAAIHLRSFGYDVLLFEKKQYPRHKVCGEYVSNEIVPYLGGLGICLKEVGAINIDELQISTQSGVSVSSRLPLGGLGISRYAFDNLLYEKALSLGVVVKFQSVIEIRFQNELFEVTTDIDELYSSKIVIGSYGKRSGLDKVLQRDFINQKSSWLAVKGHYKYAGFQKNKVALHNFKGGYGGLSMNENGLINFCYLVKYQSFKQFNDINDFNSEVISKNPYLFSFLKEAIPVFDQPMTIAQISFDSKKAIQNHILMCGDSAGLIHPLCGNGMAMAIHSAKLASERIHQYLENKKYLRSQLEFDYRQEWNNAFKQRLWVGRRVQSVLMNETLAKAGVAVAVRSPKLLQSIITKTHGAPLE